MKNPKVYLKQAKEMVTSPEVQTKVRELVKTGIEKAVDGANRAVKWWKDLESHRTGEVVPADVLAKKRSSPAKKRSSKASKKPASAAVKTAPAKVQAAKKPVAKKLVAKESVKPAAKKPVAKSVKKSPAKKAKAK